MYWSLFMVGAAILVFFVLLVSTCVPYSFLRSYSANANSYTISLLGCASCGVFIATCFLGLVPHVRHQEMQLRNNQTISTDSFYVPSTDELIVIGFLMILIIEQIITGFGTTLESRGHSHSSQTIKMRKLVDEEDGEDARPLVEMEGEDHDNDNVDIIFRQNGSLPSPGDDSPSKGGGSSLRVWFLLLGMSVHSFFEGIALGVQKESNSFTQILFAILFHEILCCISYGVQLAKQNATKLYAWTSTLFLCSTIPVGMLLAVLVDGLSEEKWQRMARYWLEGLAAGTFVHVALVELLPMELHSEDGHGHSHSILPEDDHHNGHSHSKGSQWRNLWKSVFVALGIGKMSVIFSNEKFAVLDEALYLEKIYKELNFIPNPSLFDINGKFMMQSEFEAAMKNDGKSRKRKRKAVDMSEDFFFQEKVEKDNNKRAREAAERVTNSGKKLNLGKCISSSQIVPLSEALNGVISSWVENQGEATFLNKILDGEEFSFLVPSCSTFHIGDVTDVIEYCDLNDKEFDLIIMDPPWENRSVKRKKSYSMDEAVLEQLEIGQLLSPGGILVVWATNKTGIREQLDELLEKWEMKVHREWKWLKVTKEGDPVCEMREQHKLPFESLFIAVRKDDDFSPELTALPEFFVFSSVPMAVHSHKPPLPELLAHFDIRPKNTLELFARSLMPSTTSVGFEPLLLQSQHVFRPKKQR
ncbi:unnamed protein product [Caenorhabditis auriculariae]|uniref:Uncharacterized protein n=1 Tax=Caenorhabditis auriculariae TaxID=2777116 RepID=A0A8S1H9V6_9PELO|nr:unnamed protein product [Caenorhabditis auriculariae]